MRHSHSHRQILTNALAVGVFILSTLGFIDSVRAQGKPIEPLGRSTVGSSLSDVRPLKRSENCLIEGSNADCVFTDTNGVAYVVLGDSVTAVTVTESTAGPVVKLPFGLLFGDSLDSAARKLVSGGRTWILAGDSSTSTAVILTSSGQYSGKNGWSFRAEIRFENGRLVGVSYNSGAM